MSGELDLVEVYRLEPLIGIESWFEAERPRALITRPYGFIVVEEAIVSRCRGRLYLLAKKCIDSIHASRIVGSKSVVAGLKDANAVTLQFASSQVYRDISWNDNATAVRVDEGACVAKGGVTRNNFAITMLIIDDWFKAEEGRVSTDTLRAPNYYGFQRFGVTRPNTHLLGLSMILLATGRLVREMLEVVYPLQEHNWLGDYERTLKSSLEAQKSLSLVYRRIPHRIAEILVNAVQAYLFNRILSRLVSIYGEDTCRIYNRMLVPGCGLDYSSIDARLSQIYREVFAEEGITPRDFCTARRYGVKASPYPRETCVTTHAKLYFWQNILVNAQETPSNKTTGRLVTLVFSLPRGAYATILLAEYFRLLEPNPHLLPC